MELIKQNSQTKIIKSILIIFLGSIALAISAKIKIPFYPVPMTMQTFIVMFLGISFGYKIGLATVGLYLLEGIVGLPVFSNSPERGVGLVYFTGPTMGYLIGFLTACFFASFVKKNDNYFIIFSKLILSVSSVYILGIFWLGIVLALFITIKLGLLPSIGYQNFAYTILPAIVLAVETCPFIIRTISVSFAEISQEYFIKSGNNTFLLNAVNGQTIWKQELSSVAAPIIIEKNIFIVTNNGYLVIIEEDTGEIISSTNILKILKKKKQKTRISDFIMGSGKIYSITYNGFLISSSATSGKAESFKKIGGSNISPLAINNGKLYILTDKSKILVLN